MNASDILTPSELAERLKLPVSWVYQKTRSDVSNPLPCLRAGRYLRFYWPDVCEWLRGNDSPADRVEYALKSQVSSPQAAVVN